MCGIIGIIGKDDVAERLVEGLRRLEYRGYDSAGVATVYEGTIERRRAEGKLANLVKELANNPLPGTTGIAHTRWATHGAPTTSNAHPHATREVALVHNGIIENFKPLREERNGYRSCRASGERAGGAGRFAEGRGGASAAAPAWRLCARHPVP